MKSSSANRTLPTGSRVGTTVMAICISSLRNTQRIIETGRDLLSGGSLFATEAESKF